MMPIPKGVVRALNAYDAALNLINLGNSVPIRSTQTPTICSIPRRS